MVEPVRSRPISAPRLAGTPGQLIVVRLAKAGTRVKRGDLLVEFDRTSQIKAARDREYEYRDLLAQIEKKKGEQQIDRAGRESEVALAENALRRAELDLLGIEMLPGITAEKNRLILDEAKAKVQQLRKTSDLRNRAAAADLRTLEIQRNRAKNAWDHATQNAQRMRIESPLDGLVVMKSIWKNGSMGDVQEGEEVRAGIPILDVVDPDRDAGAGQREPGRRGVPGAGSGRAHHARFVSRAHLCRQGRLRLAGRHHQFHVAAGPVVPGGVLGGRHRRTPAARPGGGD